jgi:protein-S-isoprenylcysteine O-methyltransferase Ste14
MNRNKFIITCLGAILFCILFIIALSGDWHWLEGWIFSLWLIAATLSSFIYMYLKDPALLAERSKISGSKNQKTWDKYFLVLFYALVILWFVVMPLDKRFSLSSQFPLWIKVFGGLLLIPSLYLIFESTVQNTYLSTQVRIQSERKQQVISTGVYGFVRHPQYLGVVLMCIGGPLLLNSIYGLIIGLIVIIIFMFRILGEEKMLAEELEGYKDYKKQIKYRLLPFIW